MKYVCCQRNFYSLKFMWHILPKLWLTGRNLSSGKLRERQAHLQEIQNQKLSKNNSILPRTRGDPLTPCFFQNLTGPLLPSSQINQVQYILSIEESSKSSASQHFCIVVAKFGSVDLLLLHFSQGETWRPSRFALGMMSNHSILNTNWLDWWSHWSYDSPQLSQSIARIRQFWLSSYHL